MRSLPTIGLNLIMKNEGKVLPRLLGTIYPLLDWYTVIDTGSTDNSKQIVKDFFDSKFIPGEIHDHPFVDFEDARNYAIEKIKGKADNAFWIDCDEEISIDEKFNLIDLKNKLIKYDCGLLSVQYDSSKYARVNFFNTGKPFKWKGKVHEYLTYPTETTMFSVEGLTTIVHPDGASWANEKEKYLNHAAILEKEVAKNNDPRDVFYLAQSYKDAGEKEKAIEWYRKRVDMTEGYYEERYFAQLQVGNLMTNLGKLPSEVISEWMVCSELDNLKADHLVNIIEELKGNNFHESAYIFSKYAFERFHQKNPYPQRTLFLNPSVYENQILNLHITNCLTTGRLGDLKQLRGSMNLEEYFKSIPSAWTGHRDFAVWLVKELKANIIVDLGVDYGYSTYSFASAKQGRIFGVDLFKGDQQTGFRNTHEYVLDSIKHLKVKYGIDNIKILKGDFNEVAKTWSNTIDILHIDGYHSYEAIKNDYETWSKFLGRDSIVLFHDTVAHEGVTKFFAELDLPKFNFTHSAGLGIASNNKELMGKIKEKYFKDQIEIKKNESQEKITIAFISHNAEVFKKYLEPSLINLRGEFEIFSISSKDGTPAENYNHLIEESTNKYILFVHEDVTFSPDFLEQINKVIATYPDFGAIGAVGQGFNKEYIWSETDKIKEVQVFDCCCILINKEHGIKFDSETFNEFHMYVDDYAMQVQSVGLKCYTIPIYASEAAINNEYTKEGSYFKHHSHTVNEKGYCWGRYWEFNRAMQEKWSNKILIYHASPLSGWTKKVFDNVGYTKCDKIEDADYILEPDTFTTNNHLENIEWLNGLESESLKANKPYIAFLHDDPSQHMEVNNGILFRTSFNKIEGNCFCLPSFDKQTDKALDPTDEFSIGFCGALTNKIRTNAINLLKSNEKIKSDFIIRNRFHMHFSSDEQKIHEEEFLSVMKESPYQLSIRGAGNFSHRFYETLMYGRIPVIIDDDTPLPCEDKIDWNSIAVISKTVEELPDKLIEWHNSHDVISQQKLSREIWEKYLSPKGFAGYVNDILIRNKNKFTQKTQVDVCILSYANTPELKEVTERGIRTLLESEENIQFNIFVVESSDEVGYDFPNTKTIHTWKDFNYNGYLNFAIPNGKAPYVVLCNNDLTYEKNWASNIIKEMKANPEILSASPFCPGVNNSNGSNVHLGHEVRKQLNGWCIFTKRTLFDKIGKLDEGVAFWFSDNIYADQLKFHNISHALIQDSIVRHHENNLGVTGETLSQNKKINYTTGQYDDYLKARIKYL